MKLHEAEERGYLVPGLPQREQEALCPYESGKAGAGEAVPGRLRCLAAGIVTTQTKGNSRFHASKFIKSPDVGEVFYLSYFVLLIYFLTI